MTTAEEQKDAIEKETIEESWTFECESGSCKRKFYSNKNLPRVTFLSCVNQCSNYVKIWPKVMTGNVQKQIRKFKLTSVRFGLSTPNEAVEELLKKAVNIFKQDLKQLMKSLRGHENGEFNESLKIDINVESDETSLTMETDECYNLSISVGIKN